MIKRISSEQFKTENQLKYVSKCWLLSKCWEFKKKVLQIKWKQKSEMTKESWCFVLLKYLVKIKFTHKTPEKFRMSCMCERISKLTFPGGFVPDLRRKYSGKVRANSWEGEVTSSSCRPLKSHTVRWKCEQADQEEFRSLCVKAACVRIKHQLLSLDFWKWSRKWQNCERTFQKDSRNILHDSIKKKKTPIHYKRLNMFLICVGSSVLSFISFRTLNKHNLCQTGSLFVCWDIKVKTVKRWGVKVDSVVLKKLCDWLKSTCSPVLSRTRFLPFLKEVLDYVEVKDQAETLAPLTSGQVTQECFCWPRISCWVCGSLIVCVVAAVCSGRSGSSESRWASRFPQKLEAKQYHVHQTSPALWLLWSLPW